MGAFLKKISLKVWYFLKNLVKKLANPLNIIIFIIVLVVMYSPTWVGYLIYFISKNPYHLIYANAYALFWAGPFTPFFPLCLAITFGIRKIWDRIFKNKQKKTSQETIKRAEENSSVLSPESDSTGKKKEDEEVIENNDNNRQN